MLLPSIFLAYGIGSPLIGKLSDLLGLTANPGMMRYSLLVCVAACGLSALLFWKGSRALQATMDRQSEKPMAWGINKSGEQAFGKLARRFN